MYLQDLVINFKTYNYEKRILSTIGIFMLAIAFSGCKVGDDELIKTHKGKAMFDAWSEDMQELLQTIILPCFHFNAWLEIDEEHQASLWAFLFHNSTCTVPAPGVPQIWEMRGGANYTFDLSNNPNNLAIYQPDIVVPLPHITMLIIL